MKTFHVKFTRDFEVDVHAETLEMAERLARQVVAQFPPDTARVLSIIPEGYVEPVVSKEAAPTDINAQRNAGFAERVRRHNNDDGPEAA